MKLTDRSIASFAMSFTHATNMDEDNINGMKGIYALVLLSERNRAEDLEAAKFTEIDERWVKWIARNLARLASQNQNKQMTEEQQENLEKYAMKALKTIQDAKNYQHGVMMAVALKLIPPFKVAEN